MSFFPLIETQQSANGRYSDVERVEQTRREDPYRQVCFSRKGAVRP